MNNLRRFLQDENGGEILEYVLIAGLIIVGCIAVVGAFGGKVLARWNSVNAGAL
jgi:Flp pilus assembly pilin Flp